MGNNTHEMKLEIVMYSIKQASEAMLPVIKEKLIGAMQERFKCARQTAQALLKELESNEYIHMNGEEIWTYQRWNKILESKDYDKLPGTLF